MIRVRSFWGANLSLIFLLGYFAPWILEPGTGLSFYLLAFFWFWLVGWAVALLQIFFMWRKLRKQDPSWKGEAISVLFITLTYVVVIVSALNGYLVSV